jgi:hypothetical protein
MGHSRLLRVSDAGPWRRCGLHRCRRPKAFNERNRDGRRLVGRLALWGFECGGCRARGRVQRRSALADEDTAEDQAAAGIGL